MAPRTGRPTDDPKRSVYQLRLSGTYLEKLKYCELSTQVINSSASLKSVALKNYSQYETARINTIKSNADKIKRYIEIYNKLINLEDEFLFIDEYENLLNSTKGKILSLGGSIPEN